MFQMRVRQSSPLIGNPPPIIPLADDPDLQLVAVQDGKVGGPLRRAAVAEGDYLLLRGSAEAAAAFAARKHLAFRQEAAATDLEETLFNRNSGLAEMIIPPRSRMIGTSVFPGMITESGDLIIIAVQRGGVESPPRK